MGSTYNHEPNAQKYFEYPNGENQNTKLNPIKKLGGVSN